MGEPCFCVLFGIHHNLNIDVAAFDFNGLLN